MFMLFFKNLTGSTCQKVIEAFMLLAVSWTIFDVLWIVKAMYMGSFLFGSQTLTFLSSRQIIIGFVRNFVIIILFLPRIVRYLRISKSALVGIALFGGYWLFLFVPVFLALPTSRWHSTSIAAVMFYAPLFYFFNFLPFVTAFKEGTKKTWRTFLFA